jgi:hypothetical protein
MKRNQLTITYPDACSHSLREVLDLRKNNYTNISAFCREAIAEKLERLEIEEVMR